MTNKIVVYQQTAQDFQNPLKFFDVKYILNEEETGYLIYVEERATPNAPAMASQITATGLPVVMAGAGSVSGCVVTRDAPVIFPDDDPFVLSFDNAIEDDGGYFSLDNPQRLTVTDETPRYYFILSQSSWEANATGRRSSTIILNGLETIGYNLQPSSLAGQELPVLAMSIRKLAAGDFVTVTMYQNSGGNLAVQPGADKTFFSIAPFGLAVTPPS